MSKKKSASVHFHPISAVLIFAVMFGLAAATYTYAQSEPVDEDVAACLEDGQRASAEAHYSDVSEDEAYAHAVNFWVRLQGERAKNGKFNPNRAIKRFEFLEMARDYAPLFAGGEKQININPKGGKLPKAKIKQKFAASVLTKMMGVSEDDVTAAFEEAEATSSWVLKKDAAQVFYALASQSLGDSPELALCEKEAEE